MTTYYFVSAVDSLFFRASLNFGAAGEWGDSIQGAGPPSVFAGAFRSALLAKDAEALAEYAAKGRCQHPVLGPLLGAADPNTDPGSGHFRLAFSSMAQKVDGTVTACLPATLDLVSFAGSGQQQRSALALKPIRPDPGMVLSSGNLPMRAVLPGSSSAKAAGGRWLTAAGYSQYLRGETVEQQHQLSSEDLFCTDPRLGIGLNPQTRSNEKGLIYTTDGLSLAHEGTRSVGFLIGIDGLDSSPGAIGLLGDQGLLRLGGDGRSALYQRETAPVLPKPIDPASVQSSGRFRLLLRSAGIPATGWLPPCVRAEGDGHYLNAPSGLRARLVCAATGRAEMLGGWDLQAWRPKPAVRAAPAGSVYWFEGFEGDARKLAGWVESGMPGDTDECRMRRREGYGQAALGAWPEEQFT